MLSSSCWQESSNPRLLSSFLLCKRKKIQQQTSTMHFSVKKTMKYPFAVHGKSSPISSLTHLWFGRKIEGQNSVSSIRVCTSAEFLNEKKVYHPNRVSRSPLHWQHWIESNEEMCDYIFKKAQSWIYVLPFFPFSCTFEKKSFLGIFKAIFSEIDSTSSVLKHSIYSRIQYAGKPHPYHAYYGKIQIVL